MARTAAAGGKLKSLMCEAIPLSARIMALAQIFLKHKQEFARRDGSFGCAGGNDDG